MQDEADMLFAKRIEDPSQSADVIVGVRDKAKDHKRVPRGASFIRVAGYLRSG